MGINGAHVILYTSEPDACRSILRDAFGFGHVDAGHGWLLFALPAAEVAVHPTDGPATHELSFMCDDLAATASDLRARGVDVDAEFHEERWGLVTRAHLPGGLDVLVYEPRHPTATGG